MQQLPKRSEKVIYQATSNKCIPPKVRNKDKRKNIWIDSPNNGKLGEQLKRTYADNVVRKGYLKLKMMPPLDGFQMELASMVHTFSDRTMRGTGALKTDLKGRENEILAI